jgi:hypothetical protein
MNTRLQSLFPLLVSLALGALAVVAIAIGASGALADNPCSPCSCTGNGTCQGCKPAFPVNDCTKTQTGVFVKVPLNSFFNYCIASQSGSCFSSCATCYTATKGATIYTDNTCATEAGTLGTNAYVFTPLDCLE